MTCVNCGCRYVCMCGGLCQHRVELIRVSSPHMCVCVCEQDNKITRIANLKHLVNLQVLSLGANKITDFGDMKVSTSAVS